MDENRIKYKKTRKRSAFLFITATAAVILSVNLTAGELVPESVAESTVEIEFTEGNANVDPLDPDDPDVTSNGGTGQGGSLALNYVSHLFFDEQAISPVKEEYYTTTERPYIQVTDVRGTGAGWEVYAKAGNFKNAENETTLKGSSIVFDDASLETTTENVDAPTPTLTFALPTDSDTTVKVVEAAQLTGMGTWLVKWYKPPAANPNNSVKLIVPGGSGMLGQQTAKITWYLTVGPIT